MHPRDILAEHVPENTTQPHFKLEHSPALRLSNISDGIVQMVSYLDIDGENQSPKV